jgi:hypothetical protein
MNKRLAGEGVEPLFPACYIQQHPWMLFSLLMAEGIVDPFANGQGYTFRMSSQG